MLMVGNVNFVFVTNASRYYPGGVLLVDHINYSLPLTQGFILKLGIWMFLFIIMMRR